MNYVQSTRFSRQFLQSPQVKQALIFLFVSDNFLFKCIFKRNYLFLKKTMVFTFYATYCVNANYGFSAYTTFWDRLVFCLTFPSKSFCVIANCGFRSMYYAFTSYTTYCVNAIDGLVDMPHFAIALKNVLVFFNQVLRL